VEGKNCDKKKIILFWATLATFLTKCLYELSPNCYVKVAVVIMTSASDDLVIRAARTTHQRTANKKEERVASRGAAYMERRWRRQIKDQAKHKARNPGRPG
jgi:hypothetical protein